jgi:hypothetical protein
MFTWYDKSSTERQSAALAFGALNQQGCKTAPALAPGTRVQIYSVGARSPFVEGEAQIAGIADALRGLYFVRFRDKPDAVVLRPVIAAWQGKSEDEVLAPLKAHFAAYLSRIAFGDIDYSADFVSREPQERDTASLAPSADIGFTAEANQGMPNLWVCNDCRRVRACPYAPMHRAWVSGCVACGCGDVCFDDNDPRDAGLRKAIAQDLI